MDFEVEGSENTFVYVQALNLTRPHGLKDTVFVRVEAGDKAAEFLIKVGNINTPFGWTRQSSV
jgi:hypothetical protein